MGRRPNSRFQAFPSTSLRQIVDARPRLHGRPGVETKGYTLLVDTLDQDRERITTPSVEIRRASHRVLYPISVLLGTVLDHELRVPVHRIFRHGPKGVDAVNIGPDSVVQPPS